MRLVENPFKEWACWTNYFDYNFEWVSHLSRRLITREMANRMLRTFGEQDSLDFIGRK